MSIRIFNTVTGKYVADDLASARQDQDAPREYGSREAAQQWVRAYVDRDLWYTSGERAGEFIEHSDFVIEVDGVRESVVA